ncbi:MAG: hypothetical protein RBR40_14925 [Tenuifilaceae bacterium]|nr:hypothetical protein [Tenuifilaceae bacterium]
MALHNWKHDIWSNELISTEVFRTNASQFFPSPDSMMYDPSQSRRVAFEFKPPTETKRGILTGLGQTLVYLQDASLSYLVAPTYVDGFAIGTFMEDVFQNNIYGKLPIGLILYSDDEAKEVEIRVDIAPDIQIASRASRNEGRFWAKHADLPLHGLWLLLDVAYGVSNALTDKKTEVKNIFTDTYLFPAAHQNTLNVIPTDIMKHDGSFLLHMNRIKVVLKREVDSGSKTEIEALAELARKGASGIADNRTDKALRAWFPFFIQMNLWDDYCNLTDDGYELHKYGKIHGPNSETFKFYFAKLLLVNGKHLELIIEIEKLTRNQSFENVLDAISSLRSTMIENGQFRENPNRSAEEDAAQHSTKFLKYERIIWGWLGFLPQGRDDEQYISHKGFTFNWEHITNILLYK